MVSGVSCVWLQQRQPRFCGLDQFFHTMCWVANLFGIFFILAAHEHYTIDCLIAFYLSSRLFLYYHSLAHLNALRTEAKSRIEHWSASDVLA
jgi:hypothetical protein